MENVIKSICNLEKPMASLPRKYKGNFMNDAREALHGVGMIVFNKNGPSAYPDKGKLKNKRIQLLVTLNILLY